MDALFCSVINVISVNGFFKSLHILLPLSLMSLHGICTRGKQESERDKAEPRRCGIKSIVSERYSCTGKSLLRWGSLLGKPYWKTQGFIPKCGCVHQEKLSSGRCEYGDKERDSS